MPSVPEIGSRVQLVLPNGQGVAALVLASTPGTASFPLDLAYVDAAGFPQVLHGVPVATDVKLAFAGASHFLTAETSPATPTWFLPPR